MNRINLNTIEQYEAPVIEVIEIVVEQGFAVTGEPKPDGPGGDDDDLGTW
jgi:hypothetical protein